MRFLLDTNICIYYMKGLFELDLKIEEVGNENCFISEITLAELKFGVANSINKKKNGNALSDFLEGVNIVPIYSALDLYASEKARLRIEGNIVDDFDILIGTTAIISNMILVTNNVKHFKRLKNIRIQDWTH
jgi:tRNA(fMet)-specific endonuclease VapC